MDPIWLNSRNISGDGDRNQTLSSSQLDPSLSTLETLDSASRTFLIVLYSATSVLALVGNVIVIIVETFGRRSAKNLRKFLINLAISDILFGVFAVPFTYTDFMYGRWIFPPWLCPWAQFIQILSIFITSFTLTLISIERYYAIIYPLSIQNKWLTTKCQQILAIGWLLAVGWAAFPDTVIANFSWNNQTYIDCRPDTVLYESPWYNIVSVMLTFAIPLLIQTYCYASVIRCLLSRDTRKMSQASRRHNREMTRVIRMLVALVVLFLISWLPIKILMTVITYSPEWLFIIDSKGTNFYAVSYFTCHWLAMNTSMINPIIYSFMSKSFRFDFKDLIAKICGKKRSPFVCGNVPISRSGIYSYSDSRRHSATLSNQVVNATTTPARASNAPMVSSVLAKLIQDQDRTLMSDNEMLSHKNNNNNSNDNNNTHERQKPSNIQLVPMPDSPQS